MTKKVIYFVLITYRSF